MIRRIRRRGEQSDDDVSDDDDLEVQQQQEAIIINDDDNGVSNSSSSDSNNNKNRRKTLLLSIRSTAAGSHKLFGLVALLFIGVGVVPSVVRYIYYNIILHIEEPFAHDPFLKSKIFNPIQYIQIEYFQNKPRRQNVKTFEMTDRNTYVVNLPRDTQRMTTFLQMNRQVAALVQQYPAHEWVSKSPEHVEHLRLLELQTKWENKYPFLQSSSRNGNYGDAGCSLSHIHLWEEKLLLHLNHNNHLNINATATNNNDYIFVFEDDVQILEPLLSNPQHNTIHAPDDADMVFLAPSATKRVRVPFEEDSTTDNDDGSSTVRVIGGFGTIGYIMTRRGANKIYQHLSKSNNPIDITFFDMSTNLKIYLPIGEKNWPSVRHVGGGGSTRLGRNTL